MPTLIDIVSKTVSDKIIYDEQFAEDFDVELKLNKI